MNKLSFKSTLSLLFLAALISGIGDGLIPIAFALQAHRVDSSGRGLTMVLIALWSGRFISSVVVRKLPPPIRPVGWMLSSDFVRLLAQWGLVAWVLVQGDSIASFAVSSFVYGCASSFFTPARFGLLALLFTDSQRTRVNGTLSILGDVLYIAGPLIGTAAVITLGFRTVLLIEGATFLIAMLFVLPFFRVRRNSATDDAPGTDEAEEAPQASHADPADNVDLANNADSASTDAASAQTKVNSAKKAHRGVAPLGTGGAGYLASGLPCQRFPRKRWPDMDHELVRRENLGLHGYRPGNRFIARLSRHDLKETGSSPFHDLAIPDAAVLGRAVIGVGFLSSVYRYCPSRRCRVFAHDLRRRLLGLVGAVPRERRTRAPVCHQRPAGFHCWNPAGHALVRCALWPPTHVRGYPVCPLGRSGGRQLLADSAFTTRGGRDG